MLNKGKIMAEYNLELNNYMEVLESENKYSYIKKLYWEIAIGLQQVDNLTPSKYIESLINKSINENLDNQILENMLQKYYESQDLNNNDILEEKECDLVSIRIVEMLEDDNFELNINFIKKIHEYLFKDIYEFNGNFRQINIIKNEPILNGNTIIYSDYKTIEKSLEYDLVRSNYFNNELNIKEDNTYLIKFYENLLLNKNNNLQSRDLLVKDLFIIK